MAEISEKVFLPQTENELFRASASIKHARRRALSRWCCWGASQKEIMRARPFYENCPRPTIRISLMSLRQSSSTLARVKMPRFPTKAQSSIQSQCKDRDELFLCVLHMPGLQKKNMIFRNWFRRGTQLFDNFLLG